MNKKFTSILITGLFAAGVGLTVQQPTAHAVYKWTKTKNYNNVPLRAKTKGTAYMWNWNHTKKLHNLKNYPHTTWYLSKSVKMVKGHKSGIYYQVTSGNGKVSGFVHRNYLTKVINTNGVNQGKNDKNSSGDLDNTYQNTILSVFKGTIFDKAESDFLASEDDFNRDGDTRSAEQKNNTITISNSTTLDDYNPQIHQLRTKQITFKQYLLNDLKVQGINPNNYSGYKIAMTTYQGTWDETTDVGQYLILLYK